MGSLAHPEDAASVLEQFVHDVANIPAEITHLMEEIQAKDLQIHAFKDEIQKRDAQLQKFVRINGGHVVNPKEEAFSKTINDCYDKCEILQAEKCGLAQKAMIILDRQVKRFDVGIRGLMQTEQFPSDWPGPSLLTGSGAVTGVNTPATGGGGSQPLQAVSANIGSVGGMPNIANAALNAAQLRMAAQNAASSRGTPPGGQTPASMPRSQREGSSDSNKRRRLNTSLGSLPTGPSGLRQSSLGPGTPKAGTPAPAGATSSRAGSAQPSAAHQKKGSQAPVPNRKTAPPPSKKAGNRSRPSGANKKSDRRRQLARDRATPSTNASLSDDSDNESTSPTPSSIPRTDGAGDRDDEDADDETLYCVCKKVSYGDMVGCDNDDCPYQWFHYKCVGVTEEPTGEWLCPECRKKPRKELRINRN